jgi:hypothetical protein
MEEELTTRNSVSEHALLQEHSLDTEQVTFCLSQTKVSKRYSAALAPNCPVPGRLVPPPPFSPVIVQPKSSSVLVTIWLLKVPTLWHLYPKVDRPFIHPPKLFSSIQKLGLNVGCDIPTHCNDWYPKILWCFMRYIIDTAMVWPPVLFVISSRGHFLGIKYFVLSRQWTPRGVCRSVALPSLTRKWLLAEPWLYSNERGQCSSTLWTTYFYGNCRRQNHHQPMDRTYLQCQDPAINQFVVIGDGPGCWTLCSYLAPSTVQPMYF